MGTPTRFLHISDTHFGPTRDFVFHGRIPYKDAEVLVSEILALPVKPDFIIHTGDVISFQDEDAYACAAEVLGRIKIPMYFATGNHDDPALLNRFPLFAKRNALVKRTDAVSYSFEINEYLCITLDAKHSDDENPSGILPPDQLEKLALLLNSSTKKFVVFTHFPALPIDAPWMDNNLLIANGRELHNILMQHSSRCMGVFFGHIHQPLHQYADGIQYTAVQSTTFQFGGWPTDKAILSYNQRGRPGMNLVTLDGSLAIVKHLSIPEPL